MSNSALQITSSYSSLRTSWDDIRSKASPRKRNTRGIDGVSINDFSSKRDRGIKEIQAMMRSSEGFDFSPLKASLLPKKDDGHRIICVPTIADRIVQRSIVNFLADGDKCGVFNDVSYGFIPGKSVKEAAKQVKKLRWHHPWVYKTDISQFFDSIQRDRLEIATLNAIKQRSLHNLIRSAISCEIYEPIPSRRKKISRAGIISGEGVRQGMPLSPLFANIMLKDFDLKVQKQSINMVRYADDLVVLCDSEEECLNVHRLFIDELAAIDLNIPEPGDHSKTKIYSPGESAEFLGVGLVPNGTGYSLNILKEQSNKIKELILSLADFDQLADANVTIGQFSQKIDGVISGYLTAYEFCDNSAQFKQAIDKAKTDALIRLYEKGLGLSLKSMTEAQKKFLGL